MRLSDIEQEELTEPVGAGPINLMSFRMPAWIRSLVGREGSDSQESGGGPTSVGAVESLASHVKKDPRRYKRALLQVEGVGTVLEIASATAQLDGETLPVVDLSHTGVALLKSGVSDHRSISVGGGAERGPVRPMAISLGLSQPIDVQVQQVRSSDRVLAFELVSVPTAARLLIDRFLDPKMIGLNMRAVDQSYFSDGETFSLWYCGPRDTNFFLWSSGNQLERALIQLGEEQYALDAKSGEGRLVRAKTDGKNADEPAPSRERVLFILDVALQIKDGGDAIRGLVRSLTEAAERASP